MKKIFKKIIKNIIYLIVGIIYSIHLFNDLIVKLFKKLPKFVRVIIIYTLVICTIINFTKINKTETKTIVEEKVFTIVVVDNSKEKELSKRQFENNNEQNIYNVAIANGLTDNQAILLIAISRHETGNWTSKAFKNNHNFGGIMDYDGLRNYNSYIEGLNDFVRILKTYYFEMGFDTIEKIGAKYCPVGAENDPQGLNQYWVGGVTNFYNYYLQK